MGAIYTSNGTIITAHTDLAAVGQALANGELLVKSSGDPLQYVEFMGGLLLRDQGALLPMNVILYNAWYPGQKEALEPHWNSGIFQKPADSILNLPTIDPAAQSSSILPLVAAGAIAFFLFKRRR